MASSTTAVMPLRSHSSSHRPSCTCVTLLSVSSTTTAVLPLRSHSSSRVQVHMSAVLSIIDDQHMRKNSLATFHPNSLHTTTQRYMASPTTTAVMPLRSHSSSRVQVHMSAVLSIIDHHMRKNSASGKNERVVGSLLGIHLGGGLVEITQSFPVPHVEKDKEIAIGKDFNRQMKALHFKSNPGEVVVGWYATVTSETMIDTKSCLIQDFYASSECINPIHLVVDLSNLAPMSVHAFHGVALASSPTTRALAAEFRPLPLEIFASEPERIAIATLISKTSAKTEPLDVVATQNLEQAVQKLLLLLDKVCAYVDDVVEGRTLPDPEMGRTISDLVSSVPHISPDAFSVSFNKSAQDLLMIAMLSNLTRVQLCIAEKLGSVM